VINELLTNEYQIKLVITHKDIEDLKEVRYKVLVPAYEKYQKISNIDSFLYNHDDNQSFVYILIHTPTQKPIGTIRVFFINDKTPIKRIPLQIYGGADDIDMYTNQKPICEVSRLALIRDLPPHPNLSSLKLRTILTIGLQAAIAINMYIYDYKMVFSSMAPSLYRLLHRYGVNFEPVGKEIDYFGPRIPHAIPRDKLMKEADKTLWQIAMFYLKDLATNPNAFIKFINDHPYLDIEDINLNQLIDLYQNNPNPTISELLDSVSV